MLRWWLLLCGDDSAFMRDLRNPLRRYQAGRPPPTFGTAPELVSVSRALAAQLAAQLAARPPKARNPRLALYARSLSAVTEPVTWCRHRQQLWSATFSPSRPGLELDKWALSWEKAFPFLVRLLVASASVLVCIVLTANVASLLLSGTWYAWRTVTQSKICLRPVSPRQASKLKLTLKPHLERINPAPNEKGLESLESRVSQRLHLFNRHAAAARRGAQGLVL